MEQERVRGPSRGTERMSQDPLGDTAGDTAGDSLAWLGDDAAGGVGGEDKTGRAPWLWPGQGGRGGAALGPEPEVTRSGVCCVSRGWHLLECFCVPPSPCSQETLWAACPPGPQPGPPDAENGRPGRRECAELHHLRNGYICPVCKPEDAQLGSHGTQG